SREWQHALYFRDRWTPTTKLTLDLGLRWEVYPIMHRADGRELDRLDLSNPDFARQLDVIVAGRGGNPQTNGMKAGLNNFAPRMGGTYRINDSTVFRTGYGITYNAQAWARAVRGDNDYPITIASTFQNAESYASLGRIIRLDSWGQRLRTRYDSLQVAVNKPFTHGFLLKGAYTLAKAMNESDNDGRATLSFNTPSQLDRNWAPAGFDRRHNLQVGFVYALPWQGKGNGYGSIARALASDWQFNGMFAAFSGEPFTMTANNGASVNTPSNQQTADLVGSYTVRGDAAPNGTFFDTSAFVQPTGVRFGNTGRNQFYGPGGNDLDLSVFRIFPMGAQRRLEARVEIGNLFNSGVFQNPQNDVTSGTFGQITAVRNNNGVAFYPERQVRLGLRFSF